MRPDTGMILRGSTWYLKVDVPTDVRVEFGRTQVWKSLRTGDLREAKVRATTQRAALQSQWESIREARRPKAQPQPLSDRDIQYAALHVFAALKEQSDGDRRDARTDLDRNRLRRLFEAERETLEELQDDLRWGETSALAVDMAKGILDLMGRTAPEGSDSWRALHDAIVRAMIDASKVTVARDNNDFSVGASDPLLTQPLGDEAPGWDEVTAKYRAWAKDKRAPNVDQNVRAFERLADWVGPDRSPMQVTKAHMREWRNALNDFPRSGTKSKVFRGLTMRQSIEENRRLGQPTLERATINRLLTNVSAIFEFIGSELRDDGTPNPVSGLWYDKEATEGKRRPFTPTELKAIFCAPEWFDGKDQERYWAPIVALWTGARAGEILQLECDDIYQLDGVWVFMFAKGYSADKRIKNKNSVRIFPVAQPLIDLGFLGYVDHMRKRGTRVFPSARRNSNDQISATFSRDWGRFVKRLDLNAASGNGAASVVFHSFRHGLKDAFARKGYGEQQIAACLGHATFTQSTRYGIGVVHNLPMKQEMLSAIDFGFDLAAALSEASSPPSNQE